VSGKPPVHLVGTYPPAADDNVALFVRQPPGPMVAYVSAAAALDDDLLAALRIRRRHRSRFGHRHVIAHLHMRAHLTHRAVAAVLVVRQPTASRGGFHASSGSVFSSRRTRWRVKIYDELH
jgi:hypothetical protein